MHSKPPESTISRYDTLKQVEKTTGRTPPDLLNGPKLRDEHKYAWDAFVTMREHTCNEIEAYSRLTGVKLCPWEVRLLWHSVGRERLAHNGNRSRHLSLKSILGVKAGEAAVERLGDAAQNTTAKTEKLSSSARKSGATVGDFGRKAGMAGVQLEQLAGQIAVSQNPMRALGVQAADLGFVLGARFLVLLLVLARLLVAC